MAVDITPPHRCDKLECWILIFAGKEPTRVKPLTEPNSKGKFLAWLANVRKGWKGWTNTLAYYCAELIMAVKSLM